MASVARSRSFGGLASRYLPGVPRTQLSPMTPGGPIVSQPAKAAPAPTGEQSPPSSARVGRVSVGNAKLCAGRTESGIFMPQFLSRDANLDSINTQTPRLLVVL